MKKLTFLALPLVGVICFCACTPDKTPPSPPEVTRKVTLSSQNTVVEFHSDKQLAYLNEQDYNNFVTYAVGTKKLCAPEAIKFDWSADVQSGISTYQLQLSTSNTFESYLEYSVDATYANIYNLLSDTTYFWRLKDVDLVGSFKTSNTLPRNVRIDGVNNARDLGGYTTSNGKKVKQGMVYRTGRLNKSSADEITLEVTDEGLRALKDELKITSHIDLRRTKDNEVGSITSSPMTWAKYFVCSMNYSAPAGENALTINTEEIANVFKIFADESNYPVLFQCNIGTDRTGLIAFLLNGLLGVDQKDLYRDYLFSNFSKINGMRDSEPIDEYIETLSSFEGTTLSERIENCLLSYGVTSEEITSIKNILTH